MSATMVETNMLITRWRDGDEGAAEALYNRHRDRTFRLAYGLLGDAAAAEEVAQDALTYALLNINSFDSGRSRFTTWLHLITVSRCRDRQRQRRLLTFSLGDWLRRGQDQDTSRPALEQQVIQAETRSQVWAAVQALSPPLREAIVLRYWAGHTYQEMADILDCPIGTAQSRVRLAQQRLEGALAPAVLMELEETT